MPRHWREPLDTSRHRERMRGNVGGEPRVGPKDSLIPAWAYFVRVQGFTFEFSSTEQIAESLDWFRNYKPRSSADWWCTTGFEHFPRWFERLPPGMTRKSRIPEIVKALESALKDLGPPKLKSDSERQYSRATVLRAIREHGPSWEHEPVTLPRNDPLPEGYVRWLLQYYGVEWEKAAGNMKPVDGAV